MRRPFQKPPEPMASLGASRSGSDVVALPSQLAIDQMQAVEASSLIAEGGNRDAFGSR